MSPPAQNPRPSAWSMMMHFTLRRRLPFANENIGHGMHHIQRQGMQCRRPVETDYPGMTFDPRRLCQSVIGATSPDRLSCA